MVEWWLRVIRVPPPEKLDAARRALIGGRRKGFRVAAGKIESAEREGRGSLSPREE